MEDKHQPAVETDQGGFSIVLAAPILPSKAEAWRRFVQEMTASHRHEYEASRLGLGITAEWVWLAEGRAGETALVAIKAARPERVLAEIAASKRPFDHWYTQQLLTLLGLDLHTTKPNPVDLLWVWQRRCTNK